MLAIKIELILTKEFPLKGGERTPLFYSTKILAIKSCLLIFGKKSTGDGYGYRLKRT
jgi:hypothetical protein